MADLATISENGFWSGDFFKCLNVIEKSTYIEGIGQKHRTRKRAKHTILWTSLPAMPFI